MRVFKTRRLNRFAEKEGLTDEAILKAAKEVAAGVVEANLGRNLFKKRIARTGEGKSSGYRTIVAFKSSDGEKVFFMYGFAKNQQSNITEKEKDALGIVARHYLDATAEVLGNLLKNGELIAIEEAHDNE